MKASSLAVVALLLLGGLLSWWLWRDAEAPAARPAVPRQDASQPAVAAERSPVVESAVGDAAASVAEQREAVVEAAAATTGPCVQVRVLGGEGQPVPGVDVFYSDPQAATAAHAALDEAETRRLWSLPRHREPACRGSHDFITCRRAR